LERKLSDFLQVIYAPFETLISRAKQAFPPFGTHATEALLDIRQKIYRNDIPRWSHGTARENAEAVSSFSVLIYIIARVWRKLRYFRYPSL